MMVVDLVNSDLSFTSEAHTFLWDLPEVRQNPKLMETFYNTAVMLKTNTPSPWLLRIFPDLKHLDIEDIIKRYHYEKNVDCTNINVYVELIRASMFRIDFTKFCGSDHEQFITNLVENDICDTPTRMMDIVSNYVNNLLNVCTISEALELQQICENHPEWGMTAEDFEEYQWEPLRHQILSDENVVKEYITSGSLKPEDFEAFVKCCYNGVPSEEMLLAIENGDYPRLSRVNIGAYTSLMNVEEGMTVLHKNNLNAHSYVQSCCENWRDHIELLSTIRKLLPKHPEWTAVQQTFYVDPIYVDTGDVVTTEANIKLLMQSGIVDNDYLTSMVGNILYPDYISDECFYDLAQVRELSKRNPTWEVDYTGDPMNMLRGCENNMNIIEHMLVEGYWTPDTLQHHIDTVHRATPSLMREVAKLLKRHPEWVKSNGQRVMINLKNMPDVEQLAYDLGADYVLIDGQPVMDVVATTELKRAAEFFTSKM